MSKARHNRANKANRSRKYQRANEKTQYQTASIQQRQQNRQNATKGERPTQGILQAEAERDRLIDQLWV